MEKCVERLEVLLKADVFIVCPDGKFVQAV